MRKIIFFIAIFGVLSFYAEAQNKFPTLTADLLSGEEVTFPDFLAGKKAMIALVFEDGGEYERPRNQAEGWQAFWSEELKAQGVDFYEIPMMGSLYWPMSGFIEAGMRSGIDKSLHGHIACHYGKKAEFVKAFGATNLSECHVYMIDEQGNIVVSQTGAVDAQKKEAFSNICK